MTDPAQPVGEGAYAYGFSPDRIVSSFIQGDFEPPGGAKRLPVINPADERQVAEVEEADQATVDRAVRAARAAFAAGRWSRMPVVERQAILRRIGTLIRAHADELAYLECLNSGIPMSHLANGQIPRAAYNFEFFDEYIGQSAGRVFSQDPRYLTLVTRAPVGVAALIGPWNAPLALTSMKIAGCVAFGNSCVAKPAEQTPLAVARLMTLIAEAGVPPGVVNMVNGTGAVTGEALVRHHDIDLVSFTGGTETGKHIMSAAGLTLKPTSVELGGKSANIIFDSADFNRALDGALVGIFSNNGQQCLAGSRILVQRSIATRFIEAFVARAKNIRIGDPMEPSTEIGPLGFEAHFKRVLSFVDLAVADGETLLTGGRPAAGFARGYYMEPTAFLVSSPNSRIAQQEVFGPFATFLLFDTIDEAITIANQSRFGLVAYIWSDDMPTVLRVMDQLHIGVVWVNTPMVRDLRAPFGGVKESGSGREGGDASEHFYTYEKTAILATTTVPIARLGASVQTPSPDRGGAA